jgi:outer membrane protein OmpA-like peptidoglycan-associated protein
MAGFALPAPSQDAEGCKDCPMFSRMPHFTPDDCQTRFDAVEFYLADSQTQAVEGDKCFVEYSLDEGAAGPSPLQIRRNYGNAFKQIGGGILYDADNYLSGKLVKGGKEVWVLVQIYNDGRDYSVTTVEKTAMAQEVRATDLYASLAKDGYVAIDVHFDTNKAVIKAESDPLLDQVAAMLKANTDLKLSVEGHTDSTGDAKANKTLSEQRAKAVVDALVKKGIAAARLSSVGYGAEKPVADNRTEEGRAKNRRVELVKK